MKIFDKKKLKIFQRKFKTIKKQPQYGLIPPNGTKTNRTNKHTPKPIYSVAIRSLLRLFDT